MFFVAFCLFLTNLLSGAGGAFVAKTQPPSVGSFLRIGGQITPVLQHVARGTKTGQMIGTLGSSNSRLFIWSSTRLSQDLDFRGTFELGFNYNSTVKTDPWHNSGDQSLDYRKCYISIVSKKLGTVYFGQHKTATDDTAEQDLSMGMLSIPPALYGLYLYPQDTQAISLPSGLPLKSVFHNFDGSARALCLRYDTPIWHGIGLRVDVHNANDPNAKVNKLVPGIALVANIKAPVAFRFASGVTKDLSRLSTINTSSYQWSSSVSVLSPHGTGATLAYSTRFYVYDVFSKKSRPQYYMLKLSQWLFKSSKNPVIVSLDYSSCMNMHPFSSHTDWNGNTTVYGLSIAQCFKKIGLEAFVSFKKIAFDLNGDQKDIKFDKAFVVTAGMRLVF